MIQVGDVVEAVHTGGHDRHGRPVQVPVKGRVYRVTSIYEASYGLGCTLAGMDASPYNGYVLFAKPGARVGRDYLETGWYFRPAGADEKFTAQLRKILRPPAKRRNRKENSNG